MKKRLRIPSWITTAVVAALVYYGVMYALSSETITMYWYQVIQLAAVTAISGLGLNLIYGFNGQFSLGHIGFYAIGAYGSALVTKDFTSTWSGSSTGALAWMIAGQIGIVLTLGLGKLVRPGAIRQAVSDALAKQLKPHECWTLSSVVGIVVVAVMLAIGVVASYIAHIGVDKVLAALVGAFGEGKGNNVIFAVALLNGGTMAALVAYLVGLPLLRLGSDYFGIATLGFAFMVYTALQNSDLVIATMKGARGMVGIPRWTTWGWAFGGLALCVIIMRNLVHSSHGRAIVSVREDEIAARIMGMDTAQLKAVAFAFGGFFAGVAGGLYAHLYGFLHPSSFNMIKGFDPLIIIVFGGLGSMTGTIVASMLFALVIEGLRVVLPQGFEDWRFVIYPIFLLIIMLVRQQGLLGTNEWGWLRAPLPPERDIPTPSHEPSAERQATGEGA